MSSSQLLAVLRVDQLQRWLSGEPVLVESYLTQYPAVSELALELIFGECLVREELGDTPTLAEYQRRFPGSAPSLIALGASPINAPSPNAPAPPRPSAGSLPGFEILGVVGQGGTGVVYKARQLEPDRIVALKIIRPEAGEQMTALRRFDREVRSAVRINHPNIACVYEANQSGGRQYYVTEHVEGIDLQRLVDRTGFLPPERAGEFIRQTAWALQHAHERRMVHRDIKPANVMVTLPGRPNSSPTESPTDLTRTALVDLASLGTIVKVLDMGLARVVSAGEGKTPRNTLTVAGTFLGTPDYMAPEQWENQSTADIRADIYSLGCTLYFLLTGQVPFPGGTLLQKLDKHRSHQPIPAEQLRPGLPPHILEVMRRMMAKRPADRFQKPGDIAELLRGSGSGTVTPDAPRRTPAVVAQPPGEVFQFVGHAGAVEVKTGKPVSVWEQKEIVRTVAFSPDSQLAVSSAGDRTSRVWEVASGRRLSKLVGHTGDITCAYFFPDGENIVTSGWDRTVRIWEAKTGKELRCFGGGFSEYQWLIILSVALSPNGQRLAVGGSDNVLRVWDTFDGREIVRLPGHTDWITAVAFSGDGSRALTGGRDLTVRLWDLAGGRERHCYRGHTQPITALAFNPDGRHAVSSAADGSIRCWRLPL
ncbi:MAG: serine/threonine protein kinase [Planctomycetes bacterium]|nr:serine/threonine protein kinase [Planctomycetota bacterium]